MNKQAGTILEAAASIALFAVISNAILGILFTQSENLSRLDDMYLLTVHQANVLSTLKHQVYTDSDGLLPENLVISDTEMGNVIIKTKLTIKKSMTSSNQNYYRVRIESRIGNGYHRAVRTDVVLTSTGFKYTIPT